MGRDLVWHHVQLVEKVGEQLDGAGALPLREPVDHRYASVKGGDEREGVLWRQGVVPGVLAHGADELAEGRLGGWPLHRGQVSVDLGITTIITIYITRK